MYERQIKQNLLTVLDPKPLNTPKPYTLKAPSRKTTKKTEILDPKLYTLKAPSLNTPENPKP